MSFLSLCPLPPASSLSDFPSHFLSVSACLGALVSVISPSCWHSLASCRACLCSCVCFCVCFQTHSCARSSRFQSSSSNLFSSGPFVHALSLAALFLHMLMPGCFTTRFGVCVCLCRFVHGCLGSRMHVHVMLLHVMLLFEGLAILMKWNDHMLVCACQVSSEFWIVLCQHAPVVPACVHVNPNKHVRACLWVQDICFKSSVLSQNKDSVPGSCK